MRLNISRPNTILLLGGYKRNNISLGSIAAGWRDGRNNEGAGRGEEIMTLQSSTLFWSIFFITSLLGITQLFGYYGRGRSSPAIEYGSFVLILCLLVYALIKLRLVEFISLAALFLVTNTTMGKYVAQWLHIRFGGYVPRLREEHFRELFEKGMATSSKIDSVEIEKAALEYSQKVRMF